MRSIIAFFALSLALNASAAVYKWVQPDGSVIYSDRAPQENTAPTELPSLQQIKMPPPPPQNTDTTSANSASGAQATQYSKLEIVSPANNSAFRNNAGQVTVKLDLQPALQGDDAISLTLDGREVGQTRATSLTLKNVNRGTHNLGAAIKDSQGATLISASPVTFTLQRTSVLLRHKP
jgi:hypothetical protein